MAINKLYDDQDFQKQQLLNARIGNVTTAQRLNMLLGSSDYGLIVYDTNLLTQFIWNGVAWIASKATDLNLIVTSNGQTQFNIFSIPTGLSILLINGVEYYTPDSFTFITGVNIYLNWLNEFPLNTDDKLIFRTF